MSKDSFYTPKILADKLIGFINKKHVREVVDFCVGDGELLRAAELNWPGVQCFGTDISKEAIKFTKSKHKSWKLSVLDFLDTEAKKKAVVLKKQKKFELILLNPPFSCFGAETNEVNFDGETYYVSTAMTFLLEAIRHLKNNGSLYAILPASVAYSQKDRKLWCTLEEKFNLCVLEESSVRYFKGCSPRIIIVSLNDFDQNSKYKSIPRISLEIEGITVFRGKISMNSIPKTIGECFLVHTTNLRNNILEGLEKKPKSDHAKVTGPAILLPRVGNPNKAKICLIGSNESYVLSDCVMAIQFNDLRNANILFKYLQDNWAMVSDLYTGTGARYITVEKLNQFLNLDILNSSYLAGKAI